MLQQISNKLLYWLGISPLNELYYVNEEIEDCNVWADIRANKIKTMKENLEAGQIDLKQEIIKETGQTVLHQCVALDRLEIALLCLLNNANVNQQSNQKITPLHIAASLGRLKLAKSLLEYGADPYIKDELGQTAVDRAQI
ncbi:hypothetical protein pb186bvf_015793 [Paramecium bursaria]